MIYLHPQDLAKFHQSTVANGGTPAVPPPNPPLVPPYIMPNQASWTGATAAAGANFGNVLTPNHPYLQVFYPRTLSQLYYRDKFLAL